jgi:hypothetical protein
MSRSVAQFNELLQGLDKNATITLLVRRGDSQTFITIKGTVRQISPVRRLRLYGRNYCHLCHDMLVALEALRGEPGVAHFESRCSTSTPIRSSKRNTMNWCRCWSMARAIELCHYFLDTAKVREYLAAIPLKFTTLASRSQRRSTA